jgi:hypothetical protein
MRLVDDDPVRPRRPVAQLLQVRQQLGEEARAVANAM